MIRPGATVDRRTGAPATRPGGQPVGGPLDALLADLFTPDAPGHPGTTGQPGHPGLAGVTPLAPFPVALLDSLGTSLAADVLALAPVPTGDAAEIDGYAVRSADLAISGPTDTVDLTTASDVTTALDLADTVDLTPVAAALGGRTGPNSPTGSRVGPVVGPVAGPVVEGATVRLRVLGDLTAASWEPATVFPGTCYTVTAGAPLPVGADAVVPSGDTDGGLVTVRIHRPVGPGRGIRPAGALVGTGDVLATVGTRIGPGHVALLAAAGVETVLVRPPTRVVVAAIGDEVVVPRPGAGTAGGLGRVDDPASTAVTAAARAAGAQASRLGTVPDDGAVLHRLVDDHAHQADVLVATGATRAHREARGGWSDQVRFTAPGVAPTVELGYGLVGPRRLPVVCLPADPAGALVGFELLLRPLLRRLAGDPSPFRALTRARLDAPVRSPVATCELHPARVIPVRGGGYRARPLPAGAGFLTGYAAANALLVIGERVGRLPAGGSVDVLLLDDNRVAR